MKTQLSAERRIEKSGEFREAQPFERKAGNPERSLAKRNKVVRNVQRLGDEKRLNKPHQRPTPYCENNGR
ncbi:MAG: hypothetical protein HYR96_04395 [Deltaproteobacteria bacterium]|nr:hypothetical protein [Deltaproteobacteria bacterium]MBI3295419.1 hypothetical protein [Deltaproteobacteria bacterium]